ncbi:MAG: hypothetical protein R3C56_40405 [Pirellulaceae bacterium]
MTDLPPDCVLPRTRGENASYVIEQVRALGLNPHPTSRLMRMHEVLNSGFIPFDDPRFSTALEAVRDLQQLGFVFDQLQAHHCHENDEFKSLVKKTLKDSVFPQNDREQSVGRNSQFHLYLAAVCQNAGLHPVTYDEPDVSCTIDGREFSIAAKRIKSLDQLKRHIKKAADQIQGAGRPGIIALELSLAWNPKNMPIISRLQSQMYVAISVLKATQLFDRYHTDIYRWIQGHGVLAVLVFEFSIRLRQDDQWGLDGMSTWLETTQHDEHAKADYRLFYDRFLAGVPNLEHVGADSDA